MDISESENLVIKSGFYTLEAYIYAQGGPLVVTFEPLRGKGDKQHPLRTGWMVNYLRTRQVSHLAVKPFRNDYYRRDGLADAFQYLKESGFLSRFSRVITCGGSMGGYGALAFSGILGADTVVAFNPLTTLSRKIVPWEKRSVSLARESDWAGPCRDAAKECGSARQVYVIVDRRFALDWKHIMRLPTHNLQILNVPFLQHQLPLHLNKLGLLEPIFDNMIQDQLSLMPFNKLIRSRRELSHYYTVLQETPRVAKSRKFTEIVQRFKREKQLI